MKTGLVRLGFGRLLAVAMATLVCVSMWGCSDDVTFEWGEFRSDRSIAGFIDDSLVIVTDCRRWHEITEGWNGSYSEETSCGHDRMLIYNYRVQEEGPRWTDSLTNKSSGGYWKQLTDSIVWKWDGGGQEKLKFWKIGLPATELKLKKIYESCSDDFGINRMHQWLDKTFIALGGNFSTDGDSCQYAVLDTVEKTLIYKRLHKDLEWIKKCNDVRAWGKDVYCLVLDEKDGSSFVLKNGKDSIFAPMEKIYEGHFSGNMIELGVRICSLIKDEITCSDVKWTGNRELEFYRNDGIVIYLK